MNVCIKWFTPNRIEFLIMCLYTLVSFMPAKSTNYVSFVMAIVKIGCLKYSWLWL